MSECAERRWEMVAEETQGEAIWSQKGITAGCCAMPGLHLHICTAAPNPVNTRPQMAQNESKLSYQEPVLPLRLVLCCTLSSLSCFNLADATPRGLLWILQFSKFAQTVAAWLYDWDAVVEQGLKVWWTWSVHASGYGFVSIQHFLESMVIGSRAEQVD